MPPGWTSRPGAFTPCTPLTAAAASVQATRASMGRAGTASYGSTSPSEVDGAKPGCVGGRQPFEVAGQQFLRRLRGRRSGVVRLDDVSPRVLEQGRSRFGLRPENAVRGRTRALAEAPPGW